MLQKTTAAVPHGRLHRPRDGTFSVPQSKKWVPLGHMACATALGPPPETPCTEQESGAPPGPGSLQGHINANSQGKRGVDTGLIARGLSPPQTATSAPSGLSRARPQPLGVQDRSQSTPAGRTRPHVYWGCLTRWSASLGILGRRRLSHRHLLGSVPTNEAAPASSTSKCFFWSKCGATTLLWVVKLSVGTCHGSLWPWAPPRSCPGQRVYSV